MRTLLTAILVLAAARPAPAADPAELMRKKYTQVVKDYVQAKAAESEDGFYRIRDQATRKTLRLIPTGVRVHTDRIVQFSDGTVFACSDVQEAGSGTADLDFYVKNGVITRSLVHKVNGQERFTYGANNEIIPVAGAAAAPARSAAPRGQFKQVALPGTGQQQAAPQGQIPPGAAGAMPGGTAPAMQMPALPPGITLPNLPQAQQQPATQEHPQGQEHPH